MKASDKNLLLCEALLFVAGTHAGWSSENNVLPGLYHPVGVAKILMDYICPIDVVLAGCLHGICHDAERQDLIGEVERRFGHEVARLVRCGAGDGTDPDKSEARPRATGADRRFQADLISGLSMSIRFIRASSS